MQMRVPLLTFLALAAAVAGCGGQNDVLRADTSVRVPPAPPPSPATWPRYPAYPASSCWTRPFGDGAPLRAAPSRPLPRAAARSQPQQIVQRLLARLGDRRYVLRVEIGSPPPITLQHLRGYFAGAHPPANARWAYVAAPLTTRILPPHAAAVQSGAQMVAQWEAGLVTGALRDEFCAAGGPPLVGWTIGRGVIGLSDRTQALEQDFPNPSAADFRRRVALVGRRYGFSVRTLRLLRPRQLAPLLLVHTTRDRTTFVHDVPAIMKLLDPTSRTGNRTAITFEAFFFQAEDAHGPFVRVDDVYRGQTEGGEWSWNRCVYPYPHSEPFGAKRCP
jgi:hypothetical protein